MPDFFIDKFRIPPFLIPLYQAAGVEYDVPWQVLAAINEIETDYGRNLSRSSAGAEGWMQFLPATWKVYGVDANGDGSKDPFNPADAIFAAARYLKAAGAASDLKGALLSYNHAASYADSVLLRARLIGGLPDSLISSVSGLTRGHFPVRSKVRYADDPAEARTSGTATKRLATAAARMAAAAAVNVYARRGAAVVAVQDGVVAQLGSSRNLGKYLVLRDAEGNSYTYSQLKTIAASIPEAPPRGVMPGAQPTLPRLEPAPTLPASDGYQTQAAQLSRAPATATAAAARFDPQPSNDPGAQLARVLGLRTTNISTRPLHVGSRVSAETILGRIGKTSHLAPHLRFQIRPAGKGAPLIDPKPVLDGWKLLESTAMYRMFPANHPLTSPAPTIGQVLLESKDQLQHRVLSDPNVDIYPCGRRDIESGQIDRRVLATLEFLSGSGLKPSVSRLNCGHPATSTEPGAVANGSSVDLSKVNGLPVRGHQGAGSIADILVRRLLTLQGEFKPLQIVSLMQYPGVDNTSATPGHAKSIHVAFSPPYDPSSQLGRGIAAALKPKQWSSLVARLTKLQVPVGPDVSPAPLPARSAQRLSK